MDHLTQIEIDNFRGIKETDQSIPLDDLTVVMGSNGAGKSSFLQSLYCLVGGSDPIDQTPRINRVIGSHGENTVAHKYTGEAKITAQFDGQKVVTTLSDRIDSITLDGSDSGNELIRPDFDGEEENPDHVWNLFFSPGRSYMDEIDSLSAYSSEIERQGIHVKVADFLSKCTDTNFTEVYLEFKKIRIDPPNGTPYLIDISDLAHGLLKMVPAYIAAEFFEPNYLIWDDIEAAFHPKLLEQVFDWLGDMDSQAIVATHSMDALLATIDVDSTDVTVLQLAADENRRMRFEAFDKNDLEQYIGDAGHDPRFFPVNLQ